MAKLQTIRVFAELTSHSIQANFAFDILSLIEGYASYKVIRSCELWGLMVFPNLDIFSLSSS